MPYVLALCGYGGGICLLIIAALAARTTLSMLAYLACEHELKNYSQITFKAGGKRASLTLAIMTIVFMFGSSISYQIMMTSMFRYVFIQLNSDPTFDDKVDSTWFAVAQSAPMAFLLLLVSLKRDMSAFRYASVISILCLIYTAVVLIVEMPEYISYHKEKKDVEVEPIYWNLDLFTGASMCFFAFQCQVQLLPIYSELVNPIYRRIEKVVNRAVSVDFFFYLLVSVAGYCASFSDTATIVLERKTLDGKPDYACLIAIFGVMLSMVVAFPCGYNPARAELAQLIWGT